MSAFTDCCAIEAQGVELVLPYLKSTMRECVPVFNGGPLTREIQERAGDFIGTTRDGRMVVLELKVETENKHGNFFLETWSNVPHNPGWMLKCKADWLLYLFLKERQMYLIDMPALKSWSFVKGRIYDFPERVQSKYDQRNEARGRAVPISVIVEEVPWTKRVSLEEVS